METKRLEVAELLKRLQGVELEGLDYETIGKITVAGILRQNEEELRSQQPDKDGHVTLRLDVTHELKVHRGPTDRPCCHCDYYKDGIVICWGSCCPSPL
jgi:hypothetical protein